MKNMKNATPQACQLPHAIIESFNVATLIQACGGRATKRESGKPRPLQEIMLPVLL